MSLFRKKPVVIEAFQLPKPGNRNPQPFIEWATINGLTGFEKDPVGVGLYIHTLEGKMLALPDDWIIKGVAGEFYPCKPSIFEQTYEPVTE